MLPLRSAGGCEPDFCACNRRLSNCRSDGSVSRPVSSVGSASPLELPRELSEMCEMRERRSSSSSDRPLSGEPGSLDLSSLCACVSENNVGATHKLLSGVMERLRGEGLQFRQLNKSGCIQLSQWRWRFGFACEKRLEDFHLLVQSLHVIDLQLVAREQHRRKHVTHTRIFLPVIECSDHLIQQRAIFA
jgi:hypothetical protein